MSKTNRRFVYALALFTVLTCAELPALAQEQPSHQPTGTSVCTLGPDEEILREESTIAISAEAEDVILILTEGPGQSPPYFVFRDGKKTGPYAKLGEAMNVAYQGREKTPQKKRDCAVYNPGDPPENARPVSDSAEGGKQIVRFNGKTFGPYLLVFSAKATPDGAAAYFTATDNDKAWFGSSDGRVVSFGGIPTDFKFSPNGKNAAVLCQGKMSMAQMNDLSKLPPEKLTAALQEQEKKYLFTIDGKSFGPFDSSFAPYSFWYPASSNDLYYRVNDNVYRNGTLMLTASSFDDCNFYPTPDGKKYAMFNYESIVFSDGKTFPAPLDIVAFQRAGKTIFRWITLENNKRLVICERPM
jgi:hypothetical protein